MDATTFYDQAGNLRSVVNPQQFPQSPTGVLPIQNNPTLNPVTADMQRYLDEALRQKMAKRYFGQTEPAGSLVGSGQSAPRRSTAPEPRERRVDPLEERARRAKLNRMILQDEAATRGPNLKYTVGSYGTPTMSGILTTDPDHMSADEREMFLPKQSTFQDLPDRPDDPIERGDSYAGPHGDLSPAQQALMRMKYEADAKYRYGGRG